MTVKVLTHRAIGEATRINDAKMRISPVYTEREASIRINLTKLIKFGPKGKQWSRLHPHNVLVMVELIGFTQYCSGAQN